MGGQISRTRVNDGDGGIGRLKHQGHRLAHENAAPDHHRAFPGRIDALTAKHGHHASWRAAARTRLPFEESTQVEGVQTVGILFGVDGLQQGALIQAGRQRQLQQDAVHTSIGIERFDRAQHLSR